MRWECTLQRVSASSAAVDQLRRKQISNSARQMRGAFWLTYIMSAVSEKLSMRTREMYACQQSVTIRLGCQARLDYQNACLLSSIMLRMLDWNAHQNVCPLLSWKDESKEASLRCAGWSIELRIEWHASCH